MRNPAQASLGVKQYVATVRSQFCRFMVFATGDAKFYLFQPIDENLCALPIPAFPVEKKRLRDDVRRALANGWGMS